MNITHEQRIKHFQLALSMVGVTANLMTCELIRSIAQQVDEKGGAFTLDDATQLAEMLHAKYNAPVMIPPAKDQWPHALPPEVRKIVEEQGAGGAAPVSPDQVTENEKQNN